MKICTACDATYPDSTLFCPLDGTTLTPEKNINLDQVPFPNSPSDWPETQAQDENSEPLRFSAALEPPPIAETSFSPPPSYVSQSFSPMPTGSSSDSGVIYKIIMPVVVALGLIGFFMSVSQNKKSRVNVAVTRTNSTANAASSNRAVVSMPTPRTIATPAAPGKPLSPKTDLTGIWTGTFGDEPATFNITRHKGENFTGTLSKNGYVIEFVGRLNYEKAAVSIKETKVLKTPPNARWNLGENDGTISENGKEMSGTGNDKNSSYDWSFTKDEAFASSLDKKAEK